MLLFNFHRELNGEPLVKLDFKHQKECLNLLLVRANVCLRVCQNELVIQVFFKDLVCSNYGILFLLESYALFQILNRSCFFNEIIQFLVLHTPSTLSLIQLRSNFV